MRKWNSAFRNQFNGILEYWNVGKDNNIPSFHSSGVKFFLHTLLICFIVTSCKKDATTISVTPEIKFLSITPNTAKQFQDQITIAITYKDGDGDLGENNAGVKNLFITDSRNGVTYKYRIQQLAPDNANVPIQGTLNIIIANTAITDNSTSQGVSYSIYLTDRAGHESNSVTTSAIAIIN